MISSSFQTGGGRCIAYNLYGDVAHFPVAFFHGLGGSRHSIAVDEGWLRQKQWSVVSFDRPGVGGSGPLPGYTLEQVAADAAALVNHLGHQRCAAFGWSAGGPFAMAFAAAFPEMVDFLFLAGTALPIGDGKHRWWPASSLQWMALGSRLFPLPAKLLFRFSARRYNRNPAAALAGAIADSCPADRRLLHSPAMLSLFRQASDDAWGRGGYGPFCDARALGRRLFGCLEDIRIPVHLWRGEQDPLFSAAMAEKLAGRFSKATVHKVKEAGHLLYLQNLREILEVSLW